MGKEGTSPPTTVGGCKSPGGECCSKKKEEAISSKTAPSGPVCRDVCCLEEAAPMIEVGLCSILIDLQVKEGRAAASFALTLSGVSDAKLGTSPNVVQIMFSPSRVGPRSLFEAIQVKWSKATVVQAKRDGASPAARRLLIKFIISVVFCIPLVLLAFILPHTDAQAAISSPVIGAMTLSMVLGFFFSTPVILCGFHVYASALKAIFSRSLNGSVLVSISVLCAYLYSFAMSIVLMVDSGFKAEVFYETGPILLMLVREGIHPSALAHL